MDAEAYADTLPWLVFLVIDRKSGLGVAWGGAGALVCSAGLVAWSYWRGRHALVPWVALVLFAGCLVSGLASPAWNGQVSLPRALVLLCLSVLAFGSLAFTPLSERYTGALVAPALRDDPRFSRVNVEITVAWGAGSLAVAVASATTALLSGAVAFTLLDWVAPLALAAGTILWATHRWEQFRLAVDSVATGHRAGVLAQRPDGAARIPFLRHPAGAVVSGFVAAERRSKGPDATGAEEGAVIRRLPLGRGHA